MNKFYIFIGVEMHCVLNTKTKMFSGSETNFDAPPNTQINAIDLGCPGTLPTVNKKAVILAITAGIIFNMKIKDVLRFDRKNYFYSDLPKGFQITQYYEPICTNGKLGNVAIEKLFLEEDTARQLHKEDHTLLDYNRCGLPLIEIVSDCSMNSKDETIDYIEKLIKILTICNITKGNLHEGNIRCDINISVSKDKNTLGVRSEIKNLNSIKNIELAINYEYKRQIKAIENNEVLKIETRRFDEKTQTTILMRSKHTENDYKYFSEPCILPIYIDEIKSNIMNDITAQEAFESLEIYNINSFVNNIINKKLNNSNFLPVISNFMKIFINNLINLKKIKINEFNKFYLFLKNFIKTNENKILDFINNVISEVEKVEVVIFKNNPFQALNVSNIQNEFIKYWSDVNNSYDDFLNDKDIVNKLKNKLVIPNNNIDVEIIVQKILVENTQLKEEYTNRPERVIKFITGQVLKITKGQANPKAVLEVIIKNIK